MEIFHAALTAQAVRAELGTLKNELVRDIFISKMKTTALQDTLTFETFTPDEVLKRAIKFEQSEQTPHEFEKSNTAAAGASQVHGIMKIKQEPILNVGNMSTNSRRQSREKNKRRANDRKDGKNYAETKPCTRCARPFGEGHLKKWPAMGETCEKCSKPYHFA